MQTLEQIQELGLLAVLRGPSPDLTVGMVDALVAGGVTGIEITFTTPDALGVVKMSDIYCISRSYTSDGVMGMMMSNLLVTGVGLLPSTGRDVLNVISVHCY